MRLNARNMDLRTSSAVELLSLDEVMEVPELWAFAYANDELQAAKARGIAASDALVGAGSSTHATACGTTW